MKTFWLIMCGGVLSVTIGAGVARAQTVIVTNAAAGSTIELRFNTEAPRSASADADGQATIPIGRPAGVDESDVRFAIDRCGTVTRLHLFNPGVQPMAAEAGCDRREIPSLFAMRSVTTFVVDLSGSSASVHLTQGPAPRAWLAHGGAPEHTGKYFQGTPPTGLVLFGAVGLGTFSNVTATACGNLTTCTGSNVAGASAAGAAYWVTRFFGAQATFGKPSTPAVTGTGDTFRFRSTLDSRLFTVAGLAGVPVGPVRLYGLAGANRHRGAFVTTETIDNAGTQVFEHDTESWKWLFGGGLEAWMTKYVALSFEMQYARLKATDVAAAEGGIDDHLMLLIGGARVRLGR